MRIKGSKHFSFCEENRKINRRQSWIERACLRIVKWQKESFQLQKRKAKDIGKIIGKLVIIMWKQDNQKGTIKCILNKIVPVDGQDWRCEIRPGFQIISGPEPKPLFMRAIQTIIIIED